MTTHLLDTSAWMAYLRRDARLDWVDGLVEAGTLGLHDFTEGELALSGAELARFGGLERVRPAAHAVVLHVVEALRPRRIGWVDAHLVVAARANALQLVTRDAAQADFARAAGVGVFLLTEPPGPGAG